MPATLSNVGVALGLVLFVAGCSTPGPTHTYVASCAEDPIVDVLPGTPNADVPCHLTALNELYGIAYDPFTDHLFLRVFPGDFVQVIDRPARTIKRSFYVKDLPPGRGDLAIRSSDRHLFFALPTLPAVLETTLYGHTVRTITLENLDGPPAGVAYDQKRNHFLVLESGPLPRVVTYALAGKLLGTVTLDHDVRRTALAYDSIAAELYAPLRDQPAVGIFNAQGHLLRTLAEPIGNAHDFIDVGQRSLLRLF